MISYRGRLAEIGVRPGSAVSLRRDLPGGFRPTGGSPTHLTNLGAATPNPVAGWEKISCENKSTDDWTRQCQGVTSDGTWWYITSNYSGPFIAASRNHTLQGIYKLGHNMAYSAFFSLGPLYAFNDGLHIGDLDFFEDLLYVAVQNPHGVAVVDPSSGQVLRFLRIPPQQQGVDLLSWCAINPLNRYLYTSEFGGPGSPDVTRVLAYELTDPLTRVSKADIPLDPAGGLLRMRELQGGCFTPRGHLILSSSYSNCLFCCSALNGFLYGTAGIEVNSTALIDIQEVEGVCVRTGIRFRCDDTEGAYLSAEVHVILLGNRTVAHDMVWFKHYAVSAPEHL